MLDVRGYFRVFPSRDIARQATGKEIERVQTGLQDEHDDTTETGNGRMPFMFSAILPLA